MGPNGYLQNQPCHLKGKLLYLVRVYIETFRHLHLWSQHLALTSAPTFEGFKRLEGGLGQGERKRVSHMEESGVLGRSKTPFGDLLSSSLN